MSGRSKPFHKGGSSDNPDRIKSKNDTNKRDKSTINRLLMYRGGKPVRDVDGKITGGELMSRDKAGDVSITKSTGRIQPDRRWFGNTHVVGQKELDSFREAMSEKAHDPYSFILKRKALPMGLLESGGGGAAAPYTAATAGSGIKAPNLLTSESFESTFGPRAQRKRVRLHGAGEAALIAAAAISAETAAATAAANEAAAVLKAESGVASAPTEAVLDKGTSRRIWGELYKVLDCSDVVVQVLDARDPQGTRSIHVEKYLAAHASHKHLIFVLNKCDLVPTWVTRRWVQVLSKERPTLAFHASSVEKNWGKQPLMSLMRQFAKLHSDKKTVSVGFIGYPNTGKSSIINVLRAKKVCNVAPIPGETKIWQYITLTKKVLLIDCPGHVYPSATDTESDIVLKGVVRAEKLAAPQDIIPTMLSRVTRAHIIAAYGVPSWSDATDLLTQMAVRMGRLGKGGEPDVSVCARIMLFDWQRGRLPYYTAPPGSTVVSASAMASSSSSVAAGGAAATITDATGKVVIQSTTDYTGLQVQAEYTGEGGDAAPALEGEGGTRVRASNSAAAAASSSSSSNATSNETASGGGRGGAAGRGEGGRKKASESGGGEGGKKAPEIGGVGSGGKKALKASLQSSSSASAAASSSSSSSLSSSSASAAAGKKSAADLEFERVLLGLAEAAEPPSSLAAKPRGGAAGVSSKASAVVGASNKASTDGGISGAKRKRTAAASKAEARAVAAANHSSEPADAFDQLEM